jgi:pimeloyl-ACP methyl ester carboxylesterase
VTPVEFAGPNARTLRGLRSGETDPWIVLVHDEDRDLDGWLQLAGWLADHGVSVLAFDLPGHGASDDPWEPTLAVAAVRSAVDFAISEGSRRPHLVGAGIGATAALVAAADPERHIASIAAFSPHLDERVAELAHLREPTAPKLIFVGSHSEKALQEAEAVFRASVGPCQMVKFPVAEQGADLVAGKWGPHAREKVLEHVLRQG